MKDTDLILDTLHRAGVINYGGKRLDAGQTAFLVNELRHVKAQTYDKLYSPRKFRQMIPMDTSANPGAESITYRQYDAFGMAKLIHHYAGDLPMVGVSKKEFTSAVRSIGVAYSWSIQDLRAAAMAGVPLNTKKAQEAREAVENFLDEAAFRGAPDTGTTGFVNNTSVPLVTLPTTGYWPTLTVDQILANMHYMANKVVQNSKETMLPNTLALEGTTFDYVATKRVDAVSAETILSMFLKTNPYITNVTRWEKLSLAGAGGTVHRHVCYRLDPMVLTFNVPVEFEELPPQAENLAYVVPCHGRVGLVEWHYPIGAVYADTATS